MVGYPGRGNQSMVIFTGRHIGRITLEVKIYKESEFEWIHGEEKRAKERKRSRCFFIIFDNLSSLLLIGSLTH